MDTITNGKEVTRNKIVYTFDELSDKAKDRVIELEREMAYRFVDYTSDICEGIQHHVLHTLADKAGNDWHKHFTKLEVEYSLSWRQGDGVAFFGYIYRNEAPELNWAEGIEYVTLTRNHWGNHYTHSNCFNLEFFNENGDTIGSDGGSRNDIVLYLNEDMKPTLCGTSDKDNMTKDQLTMWQSMTDIMNDLRQLCVTSERVGYKVIENLTSQETVLEGIKYDTMPRKYDANGEQVEPLWWEEA